MFMRRSGEVCDLTGRRFGPYASTSDNSSPHDRSRLRSSNRNEETDRARKFEHCWRAVWPAKRLHSSLQNWCIWVYSTIPLQLLLPETGTLAAGMVIGRLSISSGFEKGLLTWKKGLERKKARERHRERGIKGEDWKQSIGERK